jgi:transcriptional regulator with XRE-family HTH domain
MEETLGKRIVQHRKRLGLTQDQLAEKLGVTAQAVSKWENDQSCPDINMLPRLAELFGITTDQLLGRETVYEAEVVEPEKKESKWEFHWDAGRKGALTTAIYVLLVGGLLFASRYFGWDAGFWSIAWPSALLVYSLAGTLHIFGVTNVVVSLLGGYFLVRNLGIIEISVDENLIFPALILLFGLSLLIDALKKPRGRRFRIHKKGNISHKTKKNFTQDGDSFDCSISFGEVTHRITLPTLRSGNASVTFGEMTLDLTGCGEIEDGCEINVGASFGELRLKVPCCYNVDCAAGTSFGDISVHGHPAGETKGRIILTGGVNFGELDIIYM